MAIIADGDYKQRIEAKQRLESLTQQQFMASKRAGRRPAIAGSSMIAEVGYKAVKNSK